MTEWYKNKFGWAGIGLVVLLYITGVLAAFPILQAFGAIFIIGAFPLIIVVSIPLVLGGWFFGLLIEKIYRSFI
jgi:hypothetical protein